METKYRIGHLSAWVAVVGYLIAVADIVIGTSVTDDTPDSDPVVPWIVFWLSIAVASIAVAVVAHTLHRRARGPLTLIGFIVAALSALGFVAIPWVWFVFGPVLSVGYLLLALGLHRHGKGVAGAPSAWDWAIPIVGPAAIFLTQVLYATDAATENPDDLDWGFTAGFALFALVVAATMVQVARSLQVAEQVTAEPSVDPLV